jgi:hypothetical protein
VPSSNSDKRLEPGALSQKVPSEAPAAQLCLLCACGRRPVELKVLGCCRLCYQRRYHSLRWFGGLRELILKRDRFRCRVCGVGRRLVVHHRDERNTKPSLVTLCIRCHVRLHRSRQLRYWVPEALLGLWRELHPAAPLQLQLPFAVTSRTPTRQLSSREAKEPSLDLAADEASDTDQRLFDIAPFLAGMPIKPGQEKAGGGPKEIHI